MALIIAHTGDLHPRSDGTIAGKLAIDPATGLSLTLTDFTASLEWMRQTMIEQHVQLLMISGDVFDRAHPTTDEVRVVMDFLKKVGKAIPVFIISGNHDIASSGSVASAIEPLKHINGVTVVERPDTIKLNIGGEPVIVNMLPYPSRGMLLARQAEGKAGTVEETNARINQGLEAIMRDFEAGPYGDTIRILMAHGSVAEAKIGEQPRSLTHDILIPLPPKDINPYDYIGIGHIHQSQKVGRNAYYCGSLMRQSFGEEHEEKGFMIAELERGEEAQVTFHQNPHARHYQTFTVEEVIEGGVIPEDPDSVYRIKGQIQEEEWADLEPIIRHWKAELPYVQISVEVVKPDRLRDSQMNEQMSMEEALDRSLARLDIVDPVLTKAKALHHELTHEVNE